MDDTRYRDFFLRPSEPCHRQYEVLRAIFVGHQSMQAAAHQFGYRYDTVRHLVSRFRRGWDAGHPTPFLPSQPADDRSAQSNPLPSLKPNSPRSLMPAPST